VAGNTEGGGSRHDKIGRLINLYAPPGLLAEHSAHHSDDYPFRRRCADRLVEVAKGIPDDDFTHFAFQSSA
jgi:hypothetical protein